MSNFLLEGPGGVPQVKLGARLATNKPVVFGSTLAVTGATTLTGSITSTSGNITLTNGNLTLTNGNISAGGTLTATGGQVAINQDSGNNVTYAVGGAPASGTHGNNTTLVAGTIYWSQLFLDCNLTLTGIQISTGGTGGTDNWIGALYNNAGTLVANSTTAGTTAGTANNMTTLAFTSTYAAVGPAYYFIALQSNGTTAKAQTYTVPASKFITGSQTGVFATLAAITPGTSYNNNVGPVACVY